MVFVHRGGFEWRRQQHRLVAWRGPERLTPAWWEQPNGHLGSLNAAENTDEDSGENTVNVLLVGTPPKPPENLQTANP